MTGTEKALQIQIEQITQERRFSLSHKETKLILGEFKSRLYTHCLTVLSKPSLGQAFDYCLKHWHGPTWLDRHDGTRRQEARINTEKEPS